MRTTRTYTRKRATPAPAPARAAAQPEAAAEPGAAVAPSSRRRRASTGGFKTKLHAPAREGYVRRWVRNDPSRILEMHDLGYDFADADTPTASLGTRPTRHAGKNEDGSPMQLILMETPKEEYDIGAREKEDALKPFEQAIRERRDTQGRVENAYAPSQQSSLTNSA